MSSTLPKTDEILAPLGVPAGDIELSRSLPGNRNPREPWYSDPNTTSNVFDPSKTVMFPDGGFYAEAMEAHGGLTASASAVAHFLQGYWINSEPRSGNGQEWWFYGSLPGTHTLAHQRPDGINVVALSLRSRLRLLLNCRRIWRELRLTSSSFTGRMATSGAQQD